MEVLHQLSGINISEVTPTAEGPASQLSAPESTDNTDANGYLANGQVSVLLWQTLSWRPDALRHGQALQGMWRMP